MRYFQRLIFYFAFAEESSLKFIPLKARNLVSLPLEGKETAAGCRMRCRMRSIRLGKRTPLCVILSGGSRVRRTESNFCESRVLRLEQAKARGACAEAGSTWDYQ